jgi:hypothetical protein
MIAGVSSPIETPDSMLRSAKKRLQADVSDPHPLRLMTLQEKLAA